MALLSEESLKTLVGVGCKPKRLSKKSADRISDLLQQKIRSRQTRRTKTLDFICMFTRLHPHFSYSLLTAVVVLAGLMAFYHALHISGAQGNLAPALVIFSEIKQPEEQSAAGNKEKPEVVQAGLSYSLKNGDTVRTSDSKLAYLQFTDQGSINLMPNTELSITHFDHLANRFYLKLDKGAIYLKTQETSQTPLSLVIRINNYSFLLTAVPASSSVTSAPMKESSTFDNREKAQAKQSEQSGHRAYFEAYDEECIKVVCYAGGLQIERLGQLEQIDQAVRDNIDDTGTMQLVSAEVAPASLKIVKGQFFKNYQPAQWPVQAIRIDEVFASEKLLSRAGFEALVLLKKEQGANRTADLAIKLSAADLDRLLQTQLVYAKVRNMISGQGGLLGAERADQLLAMQERNARHARYASRLVGSINGMHSAALQHDKKVYFYAAWAAKDYACLVSQDKGWLLRAAGLLPIKGIPAETVFMMRPFSIGKDIGLLSMNTLFVVEPATAQVKQQIPLLERGICIDNYFPQCEQGAVFFPMQNIGYCSLVVSNEKQPVWKTLFAEPFPLAPLINGKRLVIGSYYNNYLAEVDTNGRLKWKHTFKGRNFSNPVLKQSKERVQKILFYQADSTNSKIVQLNPENGKQEIEWTLAQALYTDFIFFDPFIFGIDVKGCLFSLHTHTGEIKDLTTVIRRTLTMSEWRNITPLLNGHYLFQGTDKGTLVVCNLLTGKVEEEIPVSATSAFYAPPFKLGDNLYLISNAGALYKVSGLENMLK